MGFFSPPMCSIFTPIQCFFWLEAGGEGSYPSCSTGPGGTGGGQPFGFILPMAFPRVLCRKHHPQRWDQRGFGRETMGFSCECVDAWGVGLVCFSFGKRRTTVPHASASRSERHRRRQGAGTTLSLCPTGVTIPAVPCLCELVHMCIIFLYR